MTSAAGGTGRVETVTVLCCDVVASTAQRTSLGDDRADGLAVVLDHHLRQSVLERGGHILKSTGDGLLATFDASSDALAAAVTAQQRLERHNRDLPELERLVMRIGVSAGDVRVVAHDVHGIPVVEAARLEAVAEPGSILASGLVRSLAGSRGSHRFELVGSLTLKGIREPVQAFRVAWEPLQVPDDDEEEVVTDLGGGTSWIPLPSRLTTAPIVGVIGYASALQTIAAARRRVAAGAGREVVLVFGEAGQGKTTIAAAAAREAFDDGACVLFGHSDEDLAQPYQLFVEALDHYVTHAPIDHVFAHVDAHGVELARLVPALTTRIPELRRSRSAEPDSERFLVFAAASGLLAAAASHQPLVIVFDDLQWADKASMSLLTHTVAALPTARLLVIGTVRDSEVANADALREGLGGLQRHGGYSRVDLRGLDRSEVVAFMEAGAGYPLTGNDELALAAAVHRETDGNPFFVSQLLRHLVESGTLFRSVDGRWTVDGPIEHVSLPDSVREVIGGRVVRLGRNAERTLACAAVIGRDFDLDLLASAASVSIDELMDLLEGAVTAALVREVPDQPGHFQFAHALIQHTLYDDLGLTRQHWMHRRVAEALEDLAIDDRAPRLGELARHWSSSGRAEDRAKAINYSRLAGDAALAALAPSEALGFYADAIELLAQTADPDPGLAIDLAVGLGTAQREAGVPGSRDTLLTAARQAVDFDNRRLVAAALAAHRGLFTKIGAIDDDWVEIFEAALARMTPDDPDRALVLATYCQEILIGTPLERRQALADEALAIATASGDETVIVRVLNNIAYALTSPPMLERSLARTAEGLERALHLGDPVLTFFAANWRRQACAQAGDVREMARCTEIMAELVDRLRQPTLTWVHTFGLAWLAMIRGDVATAERLANEAFVIGQESGQPDAEYIWGGQTIVIFHQRGVLDHLQPVIASMVADTPNLVGVLTGALIAADLEAGRDDEARARMAAIAADDFELEMNPLWTSGMAFFAEAAIELDEPAFAEPLLARLAPWAEQWSDNGATTANPISHFLGGLATVLGHHDEAEAYFARSAQMCRNVGTPYFLAETELLWGRMLVRRRRDGDVETARGLLQRARDAGAAGDYRLIASRAERALATISD